MTCIGRVSFPHLGNGPLQSILPPCPCHKNFLLCFCVFLHIQVTVKGKMQSPKRCLRCLVSVKSYIGLKIISIAEKYHFGSSVKGSSSSPYTHQSRLLKRGYHFINALGHQLLGFSCLHPLLVGFVQGRKVAQVSMVASSFVA